MTLAGPADQWVTGYVGYSLSMHGGASGKQAAQKALQKLMRQRIWRKGWGYNNLVPADADSTVWVLLLAESLQYPDSWRLRRALSFFYQHVSNEGGVRTFHASGSIRTFTKLWNRQITFKGWCSPHVCVTAAAGLLRSEEQNAILEFIRNTQTPDGYWNSYWWTSREYATALAVAALSKTGLAEDMARCQLAAHWILQSSLEHKTPFALGLMMEILAAVPEMYKDITCDLINRLYHNQQEDGSWQPSAGLRIPPPDITEPDLYTPWMENTGGGGSIQHDAAGLFTTATIVRALGSTRQKKQAYGIQS